MRLRKLRPPGWSWRTALLTWAWAHVPNFATWLGMPRIKVPDYGMENGCPEDMRDFWDALGWKREDKP